MTMDVLPTAVWRPRDRGKRVVARMPADPGNEALVKSILGARVRPTWVAPNARCEVARNHLRLLVEGLAIIHGAVDVFIDAYAIRKCDTRCRDAEGDECDCQCVGDNHGGASYLSNWELVGETTLLSAQAARRRYRVTREIAAAGRAWTPTSRPEAAT